MGKLEAVREVKERDVNCLENLVVAYNTVFLMSSIIIVSIAGSVKELFSDFNRLLSPSVLLLVVGSFIVLISAIGYVGIGKRSSTLLSTYTLLLVFLFVMEIAGGLGILSFRREIKSVVSSKMQKALISYNEDPMTSNLVDYVQLRFRCCGVDSFMDWNQVPHNFFSNCTASNLTLPRSCCAKDNFNELIVNKSGCLRTINYMMHKSSLLLTTTIIAICTIQVLGSYFAYSLSTTIQKLKIQQSVLKNTPQHTMEDQRVHKEKINYF